MEEILKVISIYRRALEDQIVKEELLKFHYLYKSFALYKNIHKELSILFQITKGFWFLSLKKLPKAVLYVD